jgi:type I restriction enzyme S subunit
LKLKGEKEKFYTGPVQREYVLDEGDLVVAMTDLTQNAPILGSAATIPESGRFLHNQRLGKIVDLDTELATRDFVYYLFNSDQVRAQIRGSATGATVRHTAPGRIYDVRVALPPLPVQRRIAGILSAYDELIENCERRIRVLDEMARSLYHEWFVLFRYPGHEKVPLVESALGPIPKGWSTAAFGGLYETSSGGTPSRSHPEYFQDGRIDWVKSQELLDRFIVATEERITGEGLAASSAKIFPANTVLLALYGATIGRLAILSRDAATNQACCAVMPKTAPFGREFAFFTLLMNRARIIGLRLGAAQQNISQALVKTLECIRPADDVVARYTRCTAGVLEQVLNLQRRAANLRRTRELLLPRLLSGELSVEDVA